MNPLTFVRRHPVFVENEIAVAPHVPARNTSKASVFGSTVWGFLTGRKERLIMNSQEELVGCLRNLTEAVRARPLRHLSIVWSCDLPRIACAQKGGIGLDELLKSGGRDESTSKP